MESNEGIGSMRGDTGSEYREQPPTNLASGNMNREEWLTEAVSLLRPLIKRKGGGKVPPVRVSVGFSPRSPRKAIGHASNPELATDDRSQIFISPTLIDTTDVLEVLIHELGHAIHPDAGHRGKFVTFCKAVALEGKPSATTASDTLARELKEIADELGVYPHAALAIAERKVQGTRLLKVQCPECGYTIRVTRTWIEVGTPTCPCGTEMVEDDVNADDDEKMIVTDQMYRYRTDDNRFVVQCSKTIRKNGGVVDTKWIIEDFEQSPARMTQVATRHDVSGTLTAIREGVFKYPEVGERYIFTDADEDYIPDEQEEELDNPDDGFDPDHDDEYPSVPDDFTDEADQR